MNPFTTFLKRPTLRYGSILSLGLLGLTGSPLAQDSIKDTQGILTQWIGVEKQISADENEWLVEKAVLESSIEFMENSIARLQSVIEEAEASASAGERKRAELESEKERLESVTETVSAVIGQYEDRVRALAATWPKALVEMVKTPLSRIPEGEEAEKAAVTMRLQNIIVILSQFDKFNSVVTKQKEIQEIDGTSREVTTLYYGATFAYFVDAAGDHAGYGMPTAGSGGWEWTADANLAEDVRLLVAMHEQVTDAKFIGLPAKIATP